MPRGNLGCKKGSTPKKQSARCRGVGWLLCSINQLRRVTSEHLISEKDEALLEGEELLENNTKEQQAAGMAPFKNCGRNKLVELLITICHLNETSMCNAPESLISWSREWDFSLIRELLPALRIAPPGWWLVLLPPGTCPSKPALTSVFLQSGPQVPQAWTWMSWYQRCSSCAVNLGNYCHISHLPSTGRA